MSRDSLAILIAVLAALFTGWQACEARRTRVETASAAETARKDAREASQQARADYEATTKFQAENAERSAAQADRSARAAEQSALLASRALHISERAYVDVTASLVGRVEAGKRLRFKVEFRNAGRSPAFDVEAHSGMAVMESTFAEDEALLVILARPTSRGVPSRVFLGPGAKVEQRAGGDMELPKEVTEQIAGGQAMVYVVSSVSYQDIFRHKHHTDFCGTFNAETETMDLCKSHNTAD